MRGLRIACVSVLALACSGPPPDPPSAVVRIEPATICAGDGQRTEILVDGSDSSAHLTLVPVPPDPDEPPLAFAWSLSGATAVITSGSLTSDRLVVTSTGDRPLHAQLTVTNGAGGTATTLRTVSITTATRERCTDDEDCATGECAEDLRVCIPAHPCDDDGDCETCFECEVAAARCVPRSDLAGAAP